MKIALAESLFQPKHGDYIGFPGSNPRIQVVEPKQADFIWYAAMGDGDAMRDDLRRLDATGERIISVVLGDWGYEECLCARNLQRHFSPATTDWPRCVPYRYSDDNAPEPFKDILASFVGTPVSHAHRERLKDLPGDDLVIEFRDWWHVSDAQRAEWRARYNDVMSRSRFCFCPRGYGQTTMRLTDAILRGAIPLTVSDDTRWFDQDLGRFAIRGSFDNLPDLLAAARNMRPEEYEKRRAELFRFRDQFLLRDRIEGCSGTLGFTEYIRERVEK